MITFEQRQQIIEYIHKYPNASPKDIGEIFGVTRQTVWNIKKSLPKGNKENFEKKQKEITTKYEVLLTEFEAGLLRAIERFSEEQSEMELHPLTTSARNLSQSLVHLLNSRILGHLRGIDSSVLCSVVRRFAPEMTETEILMIYKEEFEKLK